MLQLCVWSSSWHSLPTIPSILFWSRPRGFEKIEGLEPPTFFAFFDLVGLNKISSLFSPFFFEFFPFLASTLTFRITNSLGPTTMTTWSSWHTSLRAVSYNCAKKVPTTKDPSWSNYVDGRCNHMQPVSALVFEIIFPNATSMTTYALPGVLLRNMQEMECEKPVWKWKLRVSRCKGQFRMESKAVAVSRKHLSKRCFTSFATIS